MSHKYLTISFKIYNKHFNKLTEVEKQNVIDIYRDNY